MKSIKNKLVIYPGVCPMAIVYLLTKYYKLNKKKLYLLKKKNNFIYVNAKQIKRKAFNI